MLNLWLGNESGKWSNLWKVISLQFLFTLRVLCFMLCQRFCAPTNIFPCSGRLDIHSSWSCNETAIELFNHGSKDRETLTSKQNKKINKINTESVQLHSWLRTASLLLHWQKEKKNPLTYLDSSNHENKRKKTLGSLKPWQIIMMIILWALNSLLWMVLKIPFNNVWIK